MDGPEKRRRKLFAVCDEVGLGRDERLDLACMLLHRDIESFKDLTDEDRTRLLDALEGYHLVSTLIAQRMGSLSPR